MINVKCGEYILMKLYFNIAVKLFNDFCIVLFQI